MKDRILYHYCSLDSFISIITNSTLRLTNISKSNDNSEITYCMDCFQTALLSACEKFKKLNPNNNAFNKFYDMSNIELRVNEAIKNNSLTYYVFCFSESKDLLSQWRGYADNGKGVAIGFYSTAFEKLNNENFSFGKVKYNIYEKQDDIVNSTIERLKKAKNNTETEYENIINSIITKMVYEAVFYKNNAFQEEKEWRLVYYPFGNIINLNRKHGYRDIVRNEIFYDKMIETKEYKTIANNFIRNSISFFYRNNKIISYIDINFSNHSDWIIPRIILGPKCYNDDLDLRLFLTCNGINITNIKIEKSKASYR